ncbi:helix-turn-helix transcriptional regulator [Aceticella autotrophica]|nr:WYL domain-containing protein [Aceticella autotrophica]MDI6603619.1 WYL domain-containing protein [Thermoanaerobacteraceae bacterium]
MKVLMMKNGGSTQIERQWRILSILSWENKGMSINQIYSRLTKSFGEEVSLKTIKRDIDELSLIFPISEEGEGRGIKYKLEKYKIDNIIFSVYELFSLYFIREIIRKYASSELGEIAFKLIERIISFIPSLYNDYIDRLCKAFLIQKDINTDIDVKVDDLKIIEEAILDKKRIKIRYYSFTSDSVSDREVDPYMIYMRNGYYYLTGFCKMHNEIRDFRISRIKDIKILTDTFEISHSFDRVKYYMYSWDVLKGDKKYLVKIKFIGNAARLVKEFDRCRADEIIEKDDGSLLFIKTISQFDEIKRWILGYGSEAEVIEPIELKDIIKKEIIKMAGKIKEI